MRITATILHKFAKSASLLDGDFYKWKNDTKRKANCSLGVWDETSRKVKILSRSFVIKLHFLLGSSRHLQAKSFKQEENGYSPPKSVNNVENKRESEYSSF